MFLTRTVGRLVEPLAGRCLEPQDTFARVRSRVLEYSALGLKPRDRVFIHYGNSLEFFIDLLAVWQAGACAVPIDGRLTPFEVENLARSARPAISVWDAIPDDGIRQTLAAMGVTSTTKADCSSPPTGAPAPRSHFLLDDEALILFTSGTTGDPKGVVHTHRSLRARWISLEAALGLGAYRHTLCLLPTHFGHGLICNCLFPWLFGQDLYIVPPFRAETLIHLGELIDSHSISFLSSVPTVWRLAIKTAKPPVSRSLSRVFCGSAPLSGNLWRSVQEWAGTPEVMNAYGITETGSWLAGTNVPIGTPEDGFVGRAWGGVLRVLRSRDTAISPSAAEDCGAGESGHVWVNTPALMKGYLNRDDLTSQVVSQGWFATGDIGLLDERGYLYLRGREREEINKGGMKVYPGDVDAVVERFVSTLDVCTFALNDDLLGEDIGVAVVMKADDDDTLIELHRWCSHHLATHQMPRRWHVVPEIPRTSRGKVNRSHVALYCESRPAVPYARLLRRS